MESPCTAWQLARCTIEGCIGICLNRGAWFASAHRISAQLSHSSTLPNGSGSCKVAQSLSCLTLYSNGRLKPMSIAIKLSHAKFDLSLMRIRLRQSTKTEGKDPSLKRPQEAEDGFFHRILLLDTSALPRLKHAHSLLALFRDCKGV
jgi:hypothetical protein